MGKKLTIACIVLILAAFLMAPSAQAEKKFLRMFSGPSGGSWYPLGAAMMAIIEKKQ